MLMTGKKAKPIHKDAILHSDNDPDWKWIVMRNEHISAEDNFLRSMAVNGEYHRKMRELSDFRLNGLHDSGIAMNELIRLYHVGFKGVRSKEDYTFRKAIQRLYNDICCPDRDRRKNTYDQHIPGATKDEALKKGLLIERVDDFYVDADGIRRRTDQNMKQIIRKDRDCGYLIRNSKMEVLIGDGYTLTDHVVVEFVQNYEPNPKDHGNYLVPLTTQEQKKYKRCRQILMGKKLRWKSQNNLRFWVINKRNDVIYGGTQGVGLKALYRWCIEMQKGKVMPHG